VRLRSRYPSILREEIARTVPDPADIDAQIRALLGALGPCGGARRTPEVTEPKTDVFRGSKRLVSSAG
jgi:hypothetical protein